MDTTLMIGIYSASAASLQLWAVPATYLYKPLSFSTQLLLQIQILVVWNIGYPHLGRPWCARESAPNCRGHLRHASKPCAYSGLSALRHSGSQSVRLADGYAGSFITLALPEGFSRGFRTLAAGLCMASEHGRQGGQPFSRPGLFAVAGKVHAHSARSCKPRNAGGHYLDNNLESLE